MKIVVIGGSGLIGKKLVPILRQRGHEAVSASPSSGVNTLTGEGLAEALAGADVVVDVSNSPSWADAAVMEFFETSTRNLLAAEAAAGVGHHVALSVVGADRMPDSGYMRAKVNQERLIEAGGVPYTIVRATQFFEFLGGIAELGGRRRHGSALDGPHAAAGGRRRGRRPGGRRRRRAVERHRRAGRARGDVHRRVRRAIPGRERGQADGDRGPAGPLLRGGDGRPRDCTPGTNPRSARRGSRTGSAAPCLRGKSASQNSEGDCHGKARESGGSHRGREQRRRPGDGFS